MPQASFLFPDLGEFVRSPRPARPKPKARDPRLLTPTQRHLFALGRPTARRCASARYHKCRHVVPLDDLEAVALEWLWRVAVDWDAPLFTQKFLRNLSAVISRRLVDYLRQFGPIRRNGLKRQFDSLPDDVDIAQPQVVDRDESWGRIVRGLCKIEKRVLHARFREGQSFQEIGRELGMAPRDVSQICAGAIRVLKGQRARQRDELFAEISA